MPRLFLVQGRIGPSPDISLSEEETGHLRVMRLHPGDSVQITDGSGHLYKAVIKEMTRAHAILAITGHEAVPLFIRPHIILGQAIPRFSKMEYILQKATELGIDRICPLQTERGFLEKGKLLSPHRDQRWGRIIREAAKQCGQTIIPALNRPQTIEEFLRDETVHDLKLCMWEDGPREKSLSQLLRKTGRLKSISILVGPEGSFTPKEIEQIRGAGYQFVTCGPRIMRVETAALAILSICRYEWGDF